MHTCIQQLLVALLNYLSAVYFSCLLSYCIEKRVWGFRHEERLLNEVSVMHLTHDRSNNHHTICVSQNSCRSAGKARRMRGNCFRSAGKVENPDFCFFEAEIRKHAIVCITSHRVEKGALKNTIGSYCRVLAQFHLFLSRYNDFIVFGSRSWFCVFWN